MEKLQLGENLNAQETKKLQKAGEISGKFPGRRIQFYGAQEIESLPGIEKLDPAEILAIKAVASILPFRVNNYVVEELIDWDKAPNDPIYRLTFPHRDMLPPESLGRMMKLLSDGASREVIRETANQIRRQLNPHPGGQKTLNVPKLNGETVPGIQHKYRETVLVFPAAGQSCHAYCTYCFRWPQFVNLDDLKFATRESGLFQDYLRQHKEVTDVLITGGDPMTMKAWQLALYVEPLLEPDFEHIQTIRIGTKSVSYWPFRFVTDEDADDICRLFEKVVAAGKHLAIMGHYTHPREMTTLIAQEAIRRIRSTGAEIRCQTPLAHHVNDSPETLAELWQTQVKSGCIPYYLFLERPTGARHYFQLPLFQAWQIYQKAIQQVSGLARTVRGPVMSCLPGKVVLEGVAEVCGEEVFVLSFLQGRHSDWCQRPFFAEFNLAATWMSDLRPAAGREQFFFEKELAGVASSDW